MATSHVVYKTALRTHATHVLSGTEIITDAPPDNNGRGEYFSPTDLVATALASCMLTIMGMGAAGHGFSIDGTRAEVTKVMGVNPRRITEVIIRLVFPPQKYSDKQKEFIRFCAGNCPVAKSLHPDIKQDIQFEFFD